MNVDAPKNVSKTTDKALRIAYVIGTYPGFSTTFIDREIRMMRQWGLDIQLLAIRQPVERDALSQEQRRYQQDVVYLIPTERVAFLKGHVRFLLKRPGAYLGTLLYMVSRPHPSARDRLMTLLHFAEGVYAAHLLGERGVNHLHAHFVERAATVALVASRLLDIPYSLAVHAGEDIYVHPVLLPEKFSEAKFIISCTQYNLDYLKQEGIPGLDGKAFCIHHGLDVQRYPPATRPQDPPLFVSVARLVEKKGLEYLVRACRQLRDQGRDFVCHIVGSGPARRRLEALIAELSLQDTVKLCGVVPHERVIEQYDQATIFVLPCIRGDDGSLDGIPNVLAEAMAMKLPVVSTTVSAIPELVDDQVNGLLVAPRDEGLLVAALARLLDDPDLRENLGENARQAVIEKFDIERNVRSVYDVFVSQGGPSYVDQ
jgi:glycosyltransferase involved in cell wall biosynthesis